MRRAGVGAEEVRERREAETRAAPREQPARESDGVYDGSRETCADEPFRLPVQKRQVEARVVRDEHVIAGKRQEPAHCDLRAGRAAKLGVAQSRQRGDCGTDRHARVDERLEVLRQFQLTHANGADLADAGDTRAQTGRLEIHDDVCRALEREIRTEWRRQANCVATPRHARVLADDLVEQRAGQADRCVTQGEEPSGGLLGGDRPTAFLDQLDEPVGRVEA